jgi:arylsulfatase A-like enzyme
MKTERFLNLLSISLLVGASVGIIKAAHYIIANRYIQYEMFKLAVLTSQRILNANVLYFVSGAIVLSFLWLLFANILKRSKSRILLIETMAVVILMSCLIIDVLLRSITIYTLSTALKQFSFRVENLLSGEISIAEFSSLGLTHIDAAAIILAGGIAILLLCVKLAKVDFSPYRYERFLGSKILRRISVLFAALVLAVNLYALIGSTLGKPGGPNVILICVDALRADHLGLYGYDLDTSPFMDALAKDCIVFKNAISQSSWTKTSVAAFMTSDHATLNSVVRERDRLPLRTVTIAEILRNNGYTTGALVANPWLAVRFGFEQGFDHYEDDFGTTMRISEGDLTDFIDKNRGKRFFLYVHFMDVHSPYDPPAPYNKKFLKKMGRYRYRNGLMPDMSEEDLNYTMALYDGEIRFLDAKIGSLFKYLEEQSLLENTIIIFTSDHGEEFLEHGGMGHGTTLYGELLHVPLFIAHNNILNIGKSDISLPVRSIDILPTILDMLEISVQSEIDGVSLLPLMRGEAEAAAPDTILSSVASISSGNFLMSVIESGYKFIYDFDKKEGELYDFENDRADKMNLVDSEPGISQEMQNRVMSHLLALSRAGKIIRTEASIDEKTLKKLKSLGYL